MDLIDSIMSLFTYVHVSIIHFPIVTFILSSFFGILAFLLVFLKNRDDIEDARKEKIEKILPYIEFISFLNLVLGLLSIPIVALMGLVDARSIDNAVNTDMLAFKIQLTIIVTFIFVSAVLVKIYLNKIVKIQIFNDSKIISLFYLFPVLLGTFIILIIAGAGGRYVFGHTLFDNVGLGFLVPQSFDYSFYLSSNTLSFPFDILVGPIGVIILLVIFVIALFLPFKKHVTKLVDKPLRNN